MVVPLGTVTLLFTDIEGSTRLLQETGDAYVSILADHRRAIRAALAAHRGVEIDTQGDAFLIAFSNAADAAAAAIDAQRSLAAGPVRVRMGIHTGRPVRTETGYVGIDVHRGARICAAGHGGQVLVSDATRQELAPDLVVRDLGEHRLKDLKKPEWLFQLTAEGLGHSFPPLRSMNNSNLPTSASAFIGRQHELAQLRSFLARDDVRLLTLTGMGGTGKTRLAVAVATTMIERSRHGVFLVELAAITDPQRVLTTIAQTLGATTSMNDTPLDSLRRHLEGKSVLLVLDNFEQVLAAAPDIARLLESSPLLRVLVTSRERLRVRGEHEYAVAPLADADALELFIARAEAVGAKYSTDADRPTIGAICRRLDNLPLAIELAAARVKILSFTAVLARLEHRLAALTRNARDLPQRQQTLRATIDWSFDLLDPAERAGFAALSVFVGGCTAEGAAAVCSVPEELLESLVDKSLLRLDHGEDGTARFSMLETIREYATERLQATGDATIWSRHAVYFAQIARAMQTGDPARGALHDRVTGALNIGALYGREDEASLLDVLMRERENLSAALHWHIASADVSAAVSLFLDIGRLWLMRAPLHDGRAWAERLVPLDGASELPEFGPLLTMASEFPRWLGDFAGAQTMLERAVEIFRRRGENDGLAYALHSLANVLALLGRFALAEELNEEGLALSRQAANAGGIAHALNSLSFLAFFTGDYQRMRELAFEEVRMCRETGNLNAVGAGLHNLAEARRRLGELDAAAGHYQEALLMAETLGDIGFVAECADGLADVAAARGDASSAVMLWAAARRLFSQHGSEEWDPEEQRRGVEAARKTLEPSMFEAAWNTGTAMSTADICEKGASIAQLPA